MDAITCVELKPEQALAKRWLRTGLVPLPVWQWLSGRNVSLNDCLPPASSLLTQSLKAFAEPLGTHSGLAEKQSLESCLANAAQVLTYCHAHTPRPASACQQRLLAASLLPLYRGLARGSVPEVTSVLRRQLADALTVSAALFEFREELDELLCGAMADDHSPYEKFKNVLQIELGQLSQLLLAGGAKWDGVDQAALTSVVREEMKIDWRPAWGLPAVLWRLAGELIAKRPEFVVPRDWIDVPVPWNEASEHWLDVVHALEQSGAANARRASEVCLEPRIDPALPTSPDSDTASEVSEDKKVGIQPDAEAADSPTARQLPAGSTSESLDDVQRLKMEIEIADAVDALVQASRHATGQAIGNRSDGSHGENTPRPRGDDFVVPKVIIAEVRSHNDPAFVSVVRRQLGLCRSEERTMSLLAVTVTPEAEEGPMPSLQSLGLATWQQKLVNWMSDHPEVHDLYAFVSNEGELILSLMDIERNTATLILRQGLTKVLSGAMEDEGSLSRATIPARYHSGIGSVSSPKASFEPEQLIEATYRCLDAASRQGKASIKSIEVF